ncbi:glucose-1-phosphate cytidylyltransferase [Cellulomonas marina]|uniref:Glucose-1-phosphate cytidylyltransferase n=1 Tax=Cellulomonas marina TaxID=988821 RepID=A0A1I1AHY2_9CELL|nr:glucose-1-phosphate cytidylyltransferase [Cellulomonas marina]SFB35953.1 glucose-1-phosphate cytidylyltransferase [Cellulomonas marina]
MAAPTAGTDPADIPVVILCGGMGTRLREASEKLPKPLVDIGGKPILWHIMKTYEAHGFRRFVLCLGYKGDLIKRYFLDMREHSEDFTLHVGGDHTPRFHGSGGDVDWEVTFAETGLLTGTGARIKRVADYIGDSTFALTYGDGVGDVDLTAELAQHRASGLAATVTGVRPTSRFGEMTADASGTKVEAFLEKPQSTTGWVSGGYFFFERPFLDRYLDTDPGLLLERAPLQRAARDGQLGVYGHSGFWAGMDTFRDWTDLNALWDADEAPWKVWKD